MIEKCRKIGSNIIDLIAVLLIGFVFIAYFIITSAMLLRNFCEGLKVIYYPYTDITYIILLFIITITIANKLGFDSTIKTTTLIFPFLLVAV